MLDFAFLQLVSREKKTRFPALFRRTQPFSAALWATAGGGESYFCRKTRVAFYLFRQRLIDCTSALRARDLNGSDRHRKNLRSMTHTASASFSPPAIYRAVWTASLKIARVINKHQIFIVRRHGNVRHRLAFRSVRQRASL